MNARAMVTWSAAALVVDLATDNPIYRGIVVLIALDVLLVLTPPARSLRPLLLAIPLFGALAVEFNVLLSHTGAHVLVALPADWPLVGGPLTLESAAYGLTVALGIAGAVLAVAPISLVLETHELLDALPHGLERSALVVASALNLAPGIGRSAMAIRDAEKMRGWRPRGPRSWADVLVPTILSAIEDAVALAEAMEARAYGTQARSRYAPGRWRPRDTIIVATALSAAGLVLAARLAGRSLDWQPYPTLSAPTIDLALIGACLLLLVPVVPVLRWPWSDSSD